MNVLDKIKSLQKQEEYTKLHWEGTFSDYIDLIKENPKIVSSAHKRIYDMIMSYGTEEYTRNKEDLIHYKFFDDPMEDGKDAVFGLDKPLMELVSLFESASLGYGTEKRIWLLHGPVGTAKSTIARLLKKGLEAYTATDQGALYTFYWKLDDEEQECAMHEEPLNLLPLNIRNDVLEELNAGRSKDIIKSDKDLCPACRFIFNMLSDRYKGDLVKILDHVVVKRLVLSEKNRIGIGTYSPRDEKNQDSTELTGDINYRKIAIFGSESDPRCVSEDTMILTEKGIKNISEMTVDTNIADRFTPASFLVSGIEKSLVNGTYFGGKHSLKTLKTKLGYDITATSNHMLLSMEKNGEIVWKDISSLKINDYVALNRKSNLWKSSNYVFPNFEYTYYGNEPHVFNFPKEMSPDLAYIIGLWIGDGHLYINEEKHQYEFGWTKTSLEKRKLFADIFEKEFGVRPNIRGKKTLAVGGRSLITWLQNILELKHGAANKEIPRAILLSNKDVIIQCIRGMWETDGTIRSTDGSNFAMYSSISKKLTKQLHLLLLSLGIYSSFVHVKNYSWQVRVNGKEVNKLLELIPSLKEKFTFGNFETEKNHTRIDSVPYIKNILKNIYKQSSNKSELRKRYSGNLHDNKKQNISYPTIRSFLADAIISKKSENDFKKIQHIVDKEYIWLPITDIKDAGEGNVYDLSVIDTHSYWANGFVSHNCFNFDGELNIANRGMVEFIEILKLDVAFLYELLTASQEQVIKPKRFAHTPIDEVILSHSNNAEYKRLTSNELMEAFRDRTVKINVPYNLRYSDELKIYERDYGKKKNIGKHVAPHTLDIAAMWAVLTRLKTPKRSGLSLINKLKLYDGNIVQGYTEESIKEIMDEYKGDELFEGMTGISPRYIQDKLSNVLVNNQEKTCVNPFMLMGELKAGLKDNSLITSEEVRKKYIELIDLVEKEYEDVVKKEVQHALISDENVINNLFTNYVDNLKAYTQKTKIKNKFTGKDEIADERLMRSIEEKIGISEGRKDDFRREIINYIAFSDDKKFSWDSDERLRKALEAKLFEDQKDTIKIVSRVKSVMDKESQEKIDIVKTRLIRDYGYCESCASNVLEYVASIFAKGDIENK